MRAVYEREKLMLMEENKKMQLELERSMELNGRLQLDRRQIEEEYADLRSKKEAIAHWESQISEIINWVRDTIKMNSTSGNTGIAFRKHHFTFYRHACRKPSGISDLAGKSSSEFDTNKCHFTHLLCPISQEN